MPSKRPPGPASDPNARPAGRVWPTSSADPKLDMDLDISSLGFDKISGHKMGDVQGRVSTKVMTKVWI